MSSEPTFGGTIGRTVADSEPWWPDTELPPPGTPNIVLILMDDTGVAHLGCFGSMIDTPNFDRLAEAGLRYANFHTTALCSPSRAALLTGFLVHDPQQLHRRRALEVTDRRSREIDHVLYRHDGGRR